MPTPVNNVTGLRNILGESLYWTVQQRLRDSVGYVYQAISSAPFRSGDLVNLGTVDALLRKAWAFQPVLAVTDNPVAQKVALDVMYEEALSVRQGDMELQTTGWSSHFVGDILADGAMAVVSGDSVMPIRALALRVAMAMAPEVAMPTVLNYLDSGTPSNASLRIAAARALASAPGMAEKERDRIMFVLRQPDQVDVVAELIPVLPKVTWGGEALPELMGFTAQPYTVALPPALDALKELAQRPNIANLRGMRVALKDLELRIWQSKGDIYFEQLAAVALGKLAVPILAEIAATRRVEIISPEKRAQVIEALAKIGLPAVDTIMGIQKNFQVSEVVIALHNAVNSWDPMVIAEWMVLTDPLEKPSRMEFLKLTLSLRLQNDPTEDAVRAAILSLWAFPKGTARQDFFNKIMGVDATIIVRALVADAVKNDAARAAARTKEHNLSTDMLKTLNIEAVAALQEAANFHEDPQSRDKATLLLREVVSNVITRAMAHYQNGNPDEGRQLLTRLGSLGFVHVDQLFSGGDLTLQRHVIEVLRRSGPAGLLALQRVAGDSGIDGEVRALARTAQGEILGMADVALDPRSSKGTGPIARDRAEWRGWQEGLFAEVGVGKGVGK